MARSDLQGCLDDLQQFIDHAANGEQVGPDEIASAQAALEELHTALLRVSVTIHEDLLPAGVDLEDVIQAIVLDFGKDHYEQQRPG